MKLLPMLIELGFTLTTEGDRLVVAPASDLTDPLRALIRENKADLIEAVLSAERGYTALVAAVNRCCDVRGDSAENRAALIAEAADFSPAKQADLVQHFRSEAELWKLATGQGEAS